MAPALGIATAPPRPASPRSTVLFPIGARSATVLLALSSGSMAAEIGLFSLILALLLALVQAGASLYGARPRDGALTALRRGVAAPQLLFVATAFASLAS